MNNPKSFQLKHSLMRSMPHLVLRYYLMWSELRHRKIVRRIRSELGLSQSTFDFSEPRRSETVFLLGSGASINQMSEQRWDQISKCDSIGLNFWIRHSFVPTYFFFEASPPQFFKQLNRLIHSKQDQYCKVAKIVTMHVNHSPNFEWQFKELPVSWQRELVALETTTAFARNQQELDMEISRLLDRGLFNPVQPINQLFKYMGTMTSLISFSLMLGYKNIVMCGVDMKSPEYFYQDVAQYPDMSGFQSSPRTKRHVLMADNLPHCGGDVVIKSLNKLVVQPSEASLFVENDSSALFPEIPLFPEHV